MYKVTADKFQKDYCELWCVYYGVCTEKEKEDCYNVSVKRKEQLATMIYNKPTKIIDNPKGGDSN